MKSFKLSRAVRALAQSALLALFCFVVPTTNVYGANPDECLEPFECTRAPVLEAEVYGRTQVCMMAEETYSLISRPIEGLREKCIDQDGYASGPVYFSSVTWTYVLNGPNGAISTGNSTSVTYAAPQCGNYTIDWTGVGRYKCDDADTTDRTVTVTYSHTFEAKRPKYTSIIEDIKVCPDTRKLAVWKITNQDKDCSYQFIYVAQLGNGDPTITLEHATGLVDVAANSTEIGLVGLKASDDTKRGTKQLLWDVRSIYCDEPISTQSEITVPGVILTLSAADIQICPNEQKKLAVEVINDGDCDEQVDTAGILDVGDPSLVAGNPPAGRKLAKGDSIKGNVDIGCLPDSKGGKTIYHFLAQVLPFDPKVFDGKITVPVEEGQFKFGQFTDVNGVPVQPRFERGSTFRLTYKIHNPGRCDDNYSWALFSPTIGITVAGQAGGSLVLAGGATSDEFAALITIGDEVNRGVHSVDGLLKARGRKVDTAKKPFDVFVCDEDYPPTYTVGPKENPAVPVGGSRGDLLVFNNTGDCPASVTWKATKISGRPKVTITAENHAVSIARGETVEVPITVSAADDSPTGEATMEIESTDQYGNIRKDRYAVSVYKLIAVAHKAKDFEKWSVDSSVNIKLTVQGNHKDNELLYELLDVEDNKKVVWSKRSKELTTDAKVANPGRYIARGSDDVRSIEARPKFVFWKLEYNPENRQVVYNWDPEDGPIDGEAFKKVNTLGDFAKDALKQGGEVANDLVAASTDIKHELEEMYNTAESLKARNAQEIQTLNQTEAALLEQQPAAREALAARRAETRNVERLLAPQEAGVTRYTEIVSNLETDLANAVSNTEKARIANELRQARVILERYQTSASLLRASLATAREALAAAQSAYDAIVNGLRNARYALARATERLAVLNRLEERYISQLKTGTKAGLKAVTTAFEAAFAGYDIWESYTFAVSEYDRKQTLVQEQLDAANKLVERHRVALDAVLNSEGKRVPSPQEKRVVITTIPGALPMKFTETPRNPWKTQDDDIPNSEVAWDYRHLIILNGDERFYGVERPSRAGKTATVTMRLFAYGNLGESTIDVFVASEDSLQPISCESKGRTEEEALDLVNAWLGEERADIERMKILAEEIHKALQLSMAIISVIAVGTLGAVALGFGTAAIGAMAATALAVIAVVGLALFLVYWAFQWLLDLAFDHEIPLLETIEKYYPEKLES